MNWISFQPLIGGMSIGAEFAFNKPPKAILGYKNVANDLHYIDYLKKLNKDVPYLTFDGGLYSFPKTLDESSRPFYDILHDVDIVSGVPVCSGLSMLNANNSLSSKARGSEAEQNNNLLHMTEFSLSEIKPKVFVFENAPGLYTNAGKSLREKLIDFSKKYDYSLTFVKTNTFFHGIPQKRIRTFAFFWKSKTSPILQFEKRKSPSLIDYLNSFSKSSMDQDFYNSDFNNVYYKYAINIIGEDYRYYMNDNNLKTIAQIIVERNDYEISKKFGNEKEISIINKIKRKKDVGKGFWDNSHHFTGFDHVPSIIGKNMWRLIHPTEERYYSVRELMRFMGLPDDFELRNGKKDTVHISQNVPVSTSKDMHHQIVKYLNGELKFSSEKVLMIDNTKENKSGIFTIF